MPELERTPEPGKRIVIEGTDATGKSTQADMLAIQLRLNELSVLRIDEPDSARNYRGDVLVPAATELRKIIKDGSVERTPAANVVMFTAAAIANWATVTRPHLLQGGWGVQARDYRSRMAYQGHAENYGIEAVEKITEDTMDELYMNADFTVILDFPDEHEKARQARIAARGPLEKPDTFESRDQKFQQDIRDGYRIIAERDGIELINANQSRIEIADEIWGHMVGKLGLDLVKYDWQAVELLLATPNK